WPEVGALVSVVPTPVPSPGAISAAETFGTAASGIEPQSTTSTTSTASTTGVAAGGAEGGVVAGGGGGAGGGWGGGGVVLCGVVASAGEALGGVSAIRIGDTATGGVRCFMDLAMASVTDSSVGMADMVAGAMADTVGMADMVVGVTAGMVAGMADTAGMAAG